MNQKERMLAGLPYRVDQELSEAMRENKRLIWEYNLLDPARRDLRDELIHKIIGKSGEHVCFLAPFHCDYGRHIEVGENFMANYNCVILDVAKVTIGNNVLFGPNVSLITAGHPIHPDSRNSGYEYGQEIHIGHNVWLGCGVIVNPGVQIGDNVVIGSGSVVTKDIPSNCVAVGNPCRVLRKISDEDRHFYFKRERFDVNDY